MIFSVLLIVFLLGPVALWIGQGKLCMDLPSWLSAEDANYLIGGVANAEVRQNLSFEGFRSGQLQASVEKFINNHVPMRASAILGVAEIQRAVIAGSNACFSWRAYPTFFGSDFLYIPEDETIRRTPQKALPESIEGIQSFGEELAVFARANPNIEIGVIIPETSANSYTSPAYGYISDELTIDYCKNTWKKSVASVENVHIIHPDVADYAEYLNYYYRYDDHWNGFGAAEAYDLSAQVMGLPSSEEVQVRNDRFANYKFYGQNGREGKMLIDDRGWLNEPTIDTSTMKASSEISSAAVLLNGQMPLEEPSSYVLFNFYAWLYGVDSSSVIKNERKSDEEKVLLICNSYGNAFRWIVAQNCSEVYCDYDVYFSHKGDTRLQDRITSSHATKVLFVGNIKNYSTFMKRHPVYFD